MEPERWREIERVYYLAREQATDRRTAFLEQACGGDEELRREVESLLSHAEGAEEYLTAGVMEAAAHAREQPRAPDAMIGQTVSHYRIMGKLGGGGMGVVYRAEDLRLQRQVALKLITDKLAGERLIVERFEREARAAAAINHPNICTVYEVGEDSGRPFLAMELLEGETLKGRIGGKCVPLDALLDWAAQIAGGLAAAHARDIIHRDIKPANLFVTTEGQVKILDFGLAKLVRGKPAGSPESLTGPDVALGTAAYMSPEQARGEPLDARTDLFSFGAVLYEMATGRRAFDGSTTAVIFDAILNRAVTPPAKLNPDLPVKLEATIRKALEKDRARRHQTGAEILAELKAVPRKLRKRRRTRVKALAAGALLLVSAATAWFYVRMRQSRHLTNQDAIVVADFTNTTGDVVFDGTLRQGLSAQLEQSPFLSLLSDASITQTLALMTQPKDARLTQKLAREVCQRTASAATIEGSISNQGSHYVLGLRAVNCLSGDVLAEEQVAANGKERVLKALDEAATKLRPELGESLASVQKFDAPPRDVTTSSIEALQAYMLGRRALSIRHDELAAIPLFQRAASLDPNFAVAFEGLAACYNNMGQTERSAENTLRAYELRGRVSENEKFSITFYYLINVTGNLEAARKELELWSRTYPRDSVPPSGLFFVCDNLGDYQASLAAAQQALKLNPASGINYYNLARSYLRLNRLDEARATAKEALGRGAPMANSRLYMIDFLQHDTAGMEKDAAALRGKPGYEEIVTGLESDTAAYSGKLAQARELTRRAAGSAERADEPETAASFLSAAALREALAGNLEMARRQAQAGLALSKGREVEAMSALALALAGDAGQATRLAGDLAKRFPEDTIVQIEYLPMIQACTALHSGKQAGNAAKAIEALAVAARYELASVNSATPLYPACLRGEAYLAARQGMAASAEFQKILDHPGVVESFLTGAMAHLHLGRAYALAGDNLKARTAYQDFLALWKDADPDVPVLKQAKAEYAELVKAGTGVH